MKIIISERQFRLIKEDSESSETVVALDHLQTSDKWIEDLDGKYLKRYSKNNKDDVKRIQTMLTLLGYDVGHYGDGEPVIDGIYGPDTAEAVRDYQKDVFIEPIEWDEIVGPKTYTELYNDVEELGHEHAMSVEEVLLLGLEDEEIMGDEDEVHYKGDEEEEEDEEEESEEIIGTSGEYSYLGDTIVDTASERLGEPYDWGDEFDGRGGDCSGLVDWTFRNIPELDSPGRDTTSSLLNEPGFRSGRNNYDEVKKGDVLLFKGSKANHTGFVSDVDGGKVDMIHSAGSGWDKGTKRGVQVTKDIFNRYNYFKNNYLGYIPFEYFMVDQENMMV